MLFWVKKKRVKKEDKTHKGYAGKYSNTNKFFTRKCSLSIKIFIGIHTMRT